MKKLNLGNSAEVIRFTFPVQWDPADVSGLTLTINDVDGNELLAADAVTLITATTLDGDVTSCDQTFTIASDADNLAPGDDIKIVGAGGSEILNVKGYDTTTKIVTPDSIVVNSYSDGDAVYGLFGTIEVDLSDTDTFPAGEQLILLWTPAGVIGPVTELAEISRRQQMDLAGLEQYLRDIYPRAWRGIKEPRNRLEAIIQAAQKTVRNLMISKDPRFEPYRLVDQTELLAPVAAACAVIWATDGDDELKEELKKYQNKLTTEIELLSSNAHWIDIDEDDIKDDGENIAHPHIFRHGW